MKLFRSTSITDLEMRVASAKDEAGIERVCLSTADSGQDASALYSRADLPALIWATPYLAHSPKNCFVIVHKDDIVGFIVTTPNTREFEQWQREVWWPQVAVKLDGFEPKTPQDEGALNAINQPLPAYADKYPAHLHINLLPQVQGTGFGRKLMSAAMEKLAADGVSGVHLGVSYRNTNAIGFYKAMGFDEIAQTGALILGKAL